MLDRVRRRALGALRFVPANALQRLVRLGTPSYAIGAVCRIEHRGEVLLVSPAYRRGWSLPGGLVRRSESPADAVRREVLEETGLAVELAGAPIVVIDPAGRLVDFLYRGRLASGVPAVARPASAEIRAVAWVRADESLGWITDAGRMREKARWYHALGDGGTVVLEPARIRRRRRGR